MNNILIIVGLLLLILNPLLGQQCTSSQYERCLCITTTPYCTCSAITSTNALNFLSSYNSHLVSVASQGCRPCSSNCLRCSSLTLCTQCLASFELVSGNCIACPVNCQTCSNGVCSTCIGGYYIDYQTNCQVCPIIGTAICTISSLQSCLSNYWLDNNAANCISCSPNCLQCSSTTKCSTCNQGFYLLSNYTCATCQNQCLACSDSNSCTICANQTLYFNSSIGSCLAGQASNCLIYSSSSKCSQCMVGYYTNSSGLCVQVEHSQLITQCQIYGNINKTIICRNCTVGYFNLTSGCFFGCSVLCSSCFGPHYGLCYACITTAYLMNFHCIPTFNLNQGASYQLFYTAYNNPSFFSGKYVGSSGCILETISGSSEQVSIILSNLQSYEVTIYWKLYLYNLPDNLQYMSYTVTFNNSYNQISYPFNATYCLNNCNASSVCINKGSLNLAGIILNYNQVVFSLPNASLGISQVLIIADRCGGIQGNACLQCSSTSICTKCVNPQYFISSYTCVISCPANYYVRTATQTCLSQCLSGTYSDNIKLLCLQCKAPCLTCANSDTCLTCINSTYLYQQSCLQICPAKYYSNNMRRTCDSCVRPCLTCLSNLQCLSCIYGFYYNVTHSCVLKCDSGYYGNLQTLNCEKCIQPCLTCSSNVGTTCLSCINGTYLYSFTCVSSCPTGYFDTISQCTPCDSSCKSCSISSNNCTSCPLQSYLFDYKCISNCPQYYYADRIVQICAPCSKNCLQCISGQLCQKCISGSIFYASNYSCLASCPMYYYSNEQICYSCQSPCLECLSATRCLSCKGLFLFNQTCLSICPSATFGDTLTMQCLKCNTSFCNECFGSPNYCTSCNSSLILFEHECLVNCPSGYYIETTNYICLTCKDNCIVCENLTNCIVCDGTYIIQNGNCIKQCDVGYYQTVLNQTKMCKVCPQGCIDCSPSNDSMALCQSCKAGYFNFDSKCLDSCNPQYFGYNGECYKCIYPCLTCTNEKLCLSCSIGYLFNNSCLNSCPIGYYENITSNECERCSQNCLNCLSQKCVSCKNGVFLQQNACTESCSLGYYSVSSINACNKCDLSCQSCRGAPTNCTKCYNSQSILFNGNCNQNCNSGYYKMDLMCLTCPQNCIQCLNMSYCTQCSLNYYLFSNNTCLNNCPSGYFSLNGFCKQCSYPCKTCLNFQTCVTCSFGYISSGSCVSTCNPPSYLNESSLSCSICPSNCSNCLGPTNCRQCLQGVLVNGSCLNQCPQGYYNYYSLCAPCMYGCLTCSESSTCTYCFIGYLYNGVCLEFCPVGWVNNRNSSQPFCQQCIEGCLKCTVQANQCTLCGNGLFLYLYSCMSTCPLGTYKDYKSNDCDTCKSPCQTCQNGFSCTTCIYGYLLYSQQSGNQCIQGPSCPNSFYLNKINNTCVYQCPQDTYIDPIGYTCNRPCSPTYVLLKQNLTCLQICPPGMWINSQYICQSGSAPINLPTVTCQGLVLRNILIVDCSFNIPIANLHTLNIKNIQITSAQIIEIVIIDSRTIRIVTNTPASVFRQSYFTVSFLDRYQLYSQIQAQPTSITDDQQRRLAQTYWMPVQNSKSTFYLKEYFSYSNQQRETGMQLMQIAQSICIGSFIFWIFALLKNMKSTSLTFVCLMQWIYSLSLIDTTFAPNLGLFLQGFKVSNLFFGSSNPQNQYIWLIKSSYRESLWGVLNLFNFQTVFLPSIMIALVFLVIFTLTLIISKRFSPKLQQQFISDQSQKHNKKLQNPLQQKPDQQQQREQPSIFSNQKISENKKSSSQKNTPPITKNIFEANNSFIQTIKAKSLKKSRFSFQSEAKLKPQQQKPLQKENKQQSWQLTKYKLGLKCKIIHDRFYYNYWLHCILLTASPLSIAVCCQIISANTNTLIASIFFSIFSFTILALFLYRLSKQKLLISTKYWCIIYLETMIQNGAAVLSTAEIYIGIMMLMLIINIYVWNRMFNSKKANQLKYFYQINDVIRIVLLLQAFVGYTNKKHWTGDTYYYYSWVFIVTLIVLIVFAMIQNTKQFFEREEGVKKSQTKIRSQVQTSKSQIQGTTLKSKLSKNNQVEEEQSEEKSVVDFFSRHEGQQETDSDNDIIDFDKGSEYDERAPKELIRYQKTMKQ